MFSLLPFYRLFWAGFLGMGNSLRWSPPRLSSPVKMAACLMPVLYAGAHNGCRKI